MLTITICVGSSCHVRGSDDVAATLERLIAKEALTNQVELVGAFCMDACSMGVSVRIGEQLHRGLQPEETEDFFYREVLPLVRQPAGT